MWLKFGGGAGGLHHAAPPPPPGTPKRRSAPLAAAVVRFLATEPLVWGSCAARGRSCSRNPTFSLTSHLSGAAALPGAEPFLKNVCWEKSLVWGNCDAWGATFLRNLTKLECRKLDHRIQDPGSWIQDSRSWILDLASRILGPRTWMQDPGS